MAPARIAELEREIARFEPVRRALEYDRFGQLYRNGDAWYLWLGGTRSEGPTPEAACANHPTLKQHDDTPGDGQGR